MTTKEILIAARAKVAQGWCQGAYAKDAYGNTEEQEDALALLGYTGESEVIDWNDAPGRTQAEVLEAFDKTIANA
jgi:hypothetical protein